LDLHGRLEQLPGLHLLDPLGYLDFLRLTSSAKVVFTDSGGLQEETTILKVPCITLRENTERPVTVEIGSNQIVGTDTDKIVEAYRSVRDGKWRQATIPPLWDGKAADRIVEILVRQFEKVKPTISQDVSME
jgi:UDP-N-acetylglucosamine 2-epimerase (non-hydrolysing)